jgi:uncharacterized protein YecE (DUF72 family)
MPLPSSIRFGTSTWTYEGWQGLVYLKQYPKNRFKQDCLAEYADYQYKGERLFRTVGFDFTFYGPPTTRQLAHYAAQLPAGFRVCSKVWEEVTVPMFSSGLRSALRSGPNPHFLDAAFFTDQVLPPYRDAFADKTGPFILEFQRTGIEPEDFLLKLDRFLDRIPKHYEYAVEVRNPRILSKEYRAILAAHGVAHVYNHLHGMPPIWQQHEQLDGWFPAPFVLLRLLTPRDLTYAQAVKAYRPYSRIVRALPEMRRDAVLIVREALARRHLAYVLVNNRAEGSAPHTVQALADALIEP